MADFNKVLLMGNLTRDPEVRYTPKGTAVGEIGLAINDSFKGQDGTVKETVTYVYVEVWGRQAETCKQYLTKGRPVFVEGRLRLDSWEQDGKKQSRLKVVAERVQFLGGGSGSSGAARAAALTRTAPAATTAAIAAGSQSAPPSSGGQGGGGYQERAPRPAPTHSEDIPPMPSDDDIPF